MKRAVASGRVIASIVARERVNNQHLLACSRRVVRPPRIADYLDKPLTRPILSKGGAHIRSVSSSEKLSWRSGATMTNSTGERHHPYQPQEIPAHYPPTGAGFQHAAANGYFQTPPGFHYGPPPGIYMQVRTNGLAIASMVLGILWLYWVGSILALIFGYVAKSQIDKSQGLQNGRGMAITGIVLGWVWMGLLLAITFISVIASLGSQPISGR